MRKAGVSSSGLPRDALVLSCRVVDAVPNVGGGVLAVRTLDEGVGLKDTACGEPTTFTGVRLSVVDPLPSWPVLFQPQHCAPFSVASAHA